MMSLYTICKNKISHSIRTNSGVKRTSKFKNFFPNKNKTPIHTQTIISTPMTKAFNTTQNSQCKILHTSPNSTQFTTITNLKSNSKTYKSILTTTQDKKSFTQSRLLTSTNKEKKKNRISKIDLNKYKSFLNNKSQFNSTKLTKLNCKRIISSYFDITPNIVSRNIQPNLKMKFKNETISYSLKFLMNKIKNNKKYNTNLRNNKFKKQMWNDKRENVKEFDTFMNELKFNLNKTKSKTKSHKKLYF